MRGGCADMLVVRSDACRVVLLRGLARKSGGVHGLGDQSEPLHGGALSSVPVAVGNGCQPVLAADGAQMGIESPHATRGGGFQRDGSSDGPSTNQSLFCAVVIG